jgi:hypothetical protein
MHAAYRKRTGVRQCSRVRLSALVGLLLAVIVPVAQPHEQPSGRGADEPGDSGSLAAPSAEMVLGQRLTVSEVMRVGHTRRAGGFTGLADRSLANAGSVGQPGSRSRLFGIPDWGRANMATYRDTGEPAQTTRCRFSLEVSNRWWGLSILDPTVETAGIVEALPDFRLTGDGTNTSRSCRPGGCRIGNRATISSRAGTGRTSRHSVWNRWSGIIRVSIWKPACAVPSPSPSIAASWLANFPPIARCILLA